ncbi:MAG TPA: hypothetical protein VIM08_07425 [Arthrobacter sp.]
MTSLNPDIAAAYSSDAQSVLRKAASVRVMGHRMAVAVGALAVLLAVGTASQATELPFFGKESSAQDASGGSNPTPGVSGTRSTASTTPTGTSGGSPSQAASGTDGVPVAGNPLATALPAIANLPMPVDAPTLAGIVAAASPSASPSSAPTVILEPPSMSSTAAASATAPSPAGTPTPTPTTPPSAAPVAPSPSAAAATPPAAANDTSEAAVDTRSYASARLASYGWGPEQMDALNALWDTTTKWRPSQVDRGLSYIKQHYGSPAKALEFRAANNWY